MNSRYVLFLFILALPCLYYYASCLSFLHAFPASLDSSSIYLFPRHPPPIFQLFFTSFYFLLLLPLPSPPSPVTSSPADSESSTSTTHSRDAMENYSNSASDMIGSLQFECNRGRQAAITNELVDIITGMFLPILLFSPPLLPSSFLELLEGESPLEWGIDADCLIGVRLSGRQSGAANYSYSDYIRPTCDRVISAEL
jgi:hypothetical protein